MEVSFDIEKEAALGAVAFAGLAVDHRNSEVGSSLEFVASAVGGSMFPVAQNFQVFAQID
jgi:hypothetical protein